MSLGAIDFGLIVDGAVVMIENIVRRLARAARRAARRACRERHRREAGARGARGRSSFGVGIIIIVYLPILTLGGIEGKMFRPMALTVVFALVGSLLLSLTLMPVLASLFLRQGRRASSETALRATAARDRTCALLDGCLAPPAAGAGAAAVVLSLGASPWRCRLGGGVHPAARRGRHRAPGVAARRASRSRSRSRTTRRIERDPHAVSRR